MPKTDFNFYEFLGVDGNLVQPQPDSDPYHGLVIPSQAGELAIATIVGEITEAAGSLPRVEVHPNRSAKSDGDFIRSMSPGYTLVRQHVLVEVDLEAHDSYISDQMEEVASFLATRNQLPLLNPDLANNAGVKDVLTAKWPSVGYACSASYDEADKPVNPEIISGVDVVVPVRAYEWLPGPDRKSQSGQKLDPTYSPRPVKVMFAQVIEITGINPNVSQL